MAKPIAGPSSDAASCSYPLHRPPNNPQVPVNRRRRRRRSPNPSSRVLTPSSGLLSILATIAASSSTVDCSPTPPSYLCPFIADETSSIDTVASPSSEPVHLTPTPTKRRALVERYIPDQYSEGTDGRWRRVEVYTLYGSTVCTDCQQSTTAPTTAQDNVQPSYSANSSADASSTVDILDTLPTGWKPVKKPFESRTTLILVISLVLAFFICFFIIGCLFWRKTQRRKYKENDVEMKARVRRRAGIPDDDGEGLVKEVLVKQKIWARATARWKANARYSARQRRGKRIVSTTRSLHTPNSSLSLHNPSDDRLSIVQTSPSPSRPLSRRSSISSVLEESTSGRINPASQADNTEHSNPTPVSEMSPSPTHISPPAYHRRPRIPVAHMSAETPHAADSEQPNSAARSPNLSRRPSLSSARYSFQFMSPSDDRILSASSFHAAHVATDDKAILARLANLASAPPDSGNEFGSVGSSDHQVSAPLWHDEELGDFAETSHHRGICDGQESPSRSTPTSIPAPLYPPPPSKGKMATPGFYDYSYSFEDLTTLDAEAEPSAPPFEEGCISAPPLEDMYLMPSAPPLVEDTVPVDSYPGVPHWDLEYNAANAGEREGGGLGRPESDDMPQDHNREPTTCSRFSRPSSLDFNTARPVQGPIASDGTPPCYCP